MLLLNTSVGRDGICLGCTTFVGDQTATLSVLWLIGVLLATCRSDSLCLLVSGHCLAQFYSHEATLLDEKNYPESNQAD